MEKRTFDLNIKDSNEIFLFEGDIFYGIKYTCIYPNQRQESIVYRWHSDESFWEHTKRSLATILKTNPSRFVELMNFSTDEALKKCCKEIYKSKYEEVSKCFKEIIKSTNFKLETLEKIIF